MPMGSHPVQGLSWINQCVVASGADVPIDDPVAAGCFQDVSRPKCTSLISCCAGSALSWMWRAEPLFKIHVRDDAAVGRVDVVDLVVGVAADAGWRRGKSGRGGKVIVPLVRLELASSGRLGAVLQPLVRQRVGRNSGVALVGHGVQFGQLPFGHRAGDDLDIAKVETSALWSLI
eukprot:8284695-Pyramimonas_sp.AAC.1